MSDTIQLNNSRTKKLADKASEKKPSEPDIRVIGQGRSQKKSPLKNVWGEMIKSDLKEVTSNIVMDVLVPAVKNTIYDMVSQGIERALWGDSKPSVRPGFGPTRRVEYNRVRSPRRSESRRLSTRQTEEREFILNTRAEAEACLDQMYELLEEYGEVRVDQVYSMMQMSSSYTDRNWGWRDLASARVSAIRGGYILDIPQPTPLD